MGHYDEYYEDLANRARKERYDEFKRVVSYAYHDGYETDECMNLLKSKGFTQYTLKDIIEQYDVIYCLEGGEE